MMMTLKGHYSLNSEFNYFCTQRAYLEERKGIYFLRVLLSHRKDRSAVDLKANLYVFKLLSAFVPLNYGGSFRDFP